MYDTGMTERVLPRNSSKHQPLLGVLKHDKKEVSANNILARTLAYICSTAAANRKMLLMLTTSTGADAPLQGVISASTIND